METSKKNHKELNPLGTLNKFTSELKKEVSIRTSLILFYLLLITFVSVAIIYVNQKILNHVLFTLTKDIMINTGQLAKKQIEDHISPLTYNLTETVHLIAERIIIPDPTYPFMRYLLETINDIPEMYSIAWATPQGDYYTVKRNPDKTYEMVIIQRSVNPIQYTHATMTSEGKIYDVTHTPMTFDPRMRIWYLEAIQKGLIWTKPYRFTLFKYGTTYPYGISAAQAVYDENKKLRGIVSVDVTIPGLVDLIKKIKLTPHSIILLTDSNGYLIAAQSDVNPEQFIGSKITPSLLKQLQIDFPIQHLFDPSRFNEKIYHHAGKEGYLTIQETLPNNSDTDWFVSIIVPEQDILGPLQIAGVISLLCALAVLIFGIIIANYISKRITRPIRKIVREAEAIQNFELEKIIPVSSNIKEIRILTNAFETMKTGLKSFERYVPLHLIKQLFESGKIAKVGGDLQTLTILFSDIKNFTPLTEKTPPQEVMKFLYQYLNAMTKEVHKQNGTIDKYVGDMIMAFWGAPIEDDKHADHACLSALAMLETLTALNKHWEKQGLKEIVVRIGINTGPAIVGNVGSSERLNYTVLGDSVNLASRLEGANKLYKTSIIISENTLNQLTTKFRTRFLDCVIVRGKEESINIYELEPNFSDAELENYNNLFAKAFSAYKKGDWNKALAEFNAILLVFPNDNIAKIFVERCKLLQESNPEFWDGIWRLS